MHLSVIYAIEVLSLMDFFQKQILVSVVMSIRLLDQNGLLLATNSTLR